MIKKIVIFLIKSITFLVYPFYILKYKYIDRVLIILNSELTKLFLQRNKQYVGENFRIGFNSKINISKNSKLKIGNNVIISDNVFINVKNNAILEIEDNVHIGKGCRISSFEYIKIDSNTLIASYCNILDHNHVFDLKTPVKSELFISSPIIINSGVWLGTKVQINKGVEIGQFSVIGANSVVTKNVEPSAVYAGIPAKRIK